MSGKTITLPNREEMLERLLSVNDSAHEQERFYPIILKSAGNELVAQGVVMMFTLAIHDYTEGLPPMISGLLYMQMPQYIDALIDDTEVANEAKVFFEEEQKASRG